MKPIKILDTTLREGQQAVHPKKPSQGVVFTREEQIKIAKLLIEFGINYIEIASPVDSQFSKNTSRQIINLPRDKTKILIHCRCHKVDILEALSVNPDGINLFIGTSKYNLLGNKRTFKKAVALAKDSIQLIRSIDQKIFIRLSAEDIFRTSRSNLLKFILETKDLVNRFGLPDTTGVATPEEIYEIVTQVKRITKGIDLEFHGHNDRGLALANSLAAYKAGVSVLDSTILGIGERTGIASLSGLIAVVFSKNNNWLSRNYNLKMLPKIDSSVAKILRIKIPHNIPITAPGAFSHVAGVHVNAMQTNPKSYQLLRAETFGRKTKTSIISAVMGKTFVLKNAEKEKRVLTKHEAQKIASRIREEMKINGKVNGAKIKKFMFG